MREALRRLLRQHGQPPDHLSLAYGAWAPVDPADGNVPVDEACAAPWTKEAWLDRLESITVPADYCAFYDLWRASFTARHDRVLVLESTSRLLVGHGEPSAADVGLTVHRTWGVPVVPGSAVKGLLSNYIEIVYGPCDPYRAPWDRTDPDDRRRASFRGVVWKGRRIAQGPGEAYRRLFGAPDAEDDAEWRKHGLAAGSAKGEVVFHDALYVPHARWEPQPRRDREGERPFAGDVLTVHQFPYYGKRGAVAPADYHSPNPVSFLTVRPGERFLFAWSSRDPELVELVAQLLPKALADWGVGGKTSLGYGRLDLPGSWRAPAGVARTVAATSSQAARARPSGTRGQSGGRAPGGGAAQRLVGTRIRLTRVEDPKGRNRLWFQADDGLPAQFAGEKAPDVPIGGAVGAWVTNVAAHIYTVSLEPPRARGKGRPHRPGQR